VNDGADCRKPLRDGGNLLRLIRLAMVPAILHPMVRLSRRLGTTLLWIAIALLPLRGFAASLMPVLVPPAAPVAALADEAPCHGAAMDHAAATDVTVADAHHKAPTGAVGDCPTCSLCALCHGGVAQSASPSLSLPELPTPAPAAAPPSPIEPRAPDGLFRPPRALLA
jgi:hypothetical protein